MNFKSQSFLRTLGLLWRQMGAARIYLLAGATCLLVLATLGVVHLVSPRPKPSKAPVSVEVSAKTPIPKASPSAVPDKLVQEPVLAITEVSPMGRRLRDGSTNVIVRVGVAPRTNVKHGAVGI